MARQFPPHLTRSTSNTLAAPTPHSLALLSHALNQLRTQCPHAPQVDYNSAAGQEFSRLALSGAIVWDDVRAALNRFYAGAGQPVGGPALGGDFGLELVVRVIKRFERFSVGNDAWDAASWCTEMERGVWEVVKQYGGHHTTMPEVEEQQQQGNQPGGPDWRAREGDATGSGAEYAGQADPFVSHQQNGNSNLGEGSYGNGQAQSSQQNQVQQYYHHTPQQQQGYPSLRAPPYHDPRVGGSAASEGRYETPMQQQDHGVEILSTDFSRGTSSIVGPDVDESPEGDVKPRVGANSAATRGASETPKKDKDRMAVGSLVQAKMFEPRDKSVWWPGMIFESSPVPSGVYGKQSSTSCLVAPLPVKNEWHWVPPSRLRPIATSRISKILSEADSTLLTLQAQYRTAQIDPYLHQDAGKKALADGLSRKVKEAEQSVLAWRMIQGAQKDVEAEAEWMDNGKALEKWEEDMQKLQEAGEGGEGGEGEISPANGLKSEGSGSVETGSPLTPATEHEPLAWCSCGKTIPGETLIGCDNPDCRIQWYHPPCVGIVGVPKDDEGWTCAECSRSEKNDNGKRAAGKSGGGGKRKA